MRGRCEKLAGLSRRMNPMPVGICALRLKCVLQVLSQSKNYYFFDKGGFVYYDKMVRVKWFRPGQGCFSGGLRSG